MLVSIEEFRKRSKKFLEKYEAFDKKFFDIENNDDIPMTKKNELQDELYDTYKGFTALYEFKDECIMDEGYINNVRGLDNKTRKFWLQLVSFYGSQINDEMRFVGIVDALEDYYFLFQYIDNEEYEYKCVFEKEICDLLREKFTL